ncbi:MAG TPA: sulfotransferase [Candidatus Aquilonibacter sp.]|nr:sulfotransferase [Candidatus Aquilonibacter sp.]
MRPLFIIGNKRSGTSQLVRVLNLHPQVFVSHESDVAWILHQFHHDRPFRAHTWDSDRGMKLTLEAAGHLLRREASPWENFVAVQMAVMEKGNPWLPGQKKTGLKWIGDKKPMQHTDPELLKFVLEHFPEAHFLHIVRHPFEVVASSNRFNQTPDGDFWLGLSPEEKMERWAFHEQHVLQFRQTLPGRVHSLRYEDFCRGTGKILTGVFEFLQLKPDPIALREAARQTRPLSRAVPAIKCSAEAVRIAAAHGYDLRRKSGRLRALTQNIYWCAAKKLKG